MNIRAASASIVRPSRLPVAPVLLCGAAATAAWTHPPPAPPPDFDKMAADARALIRELVEANTTNPPGNEAKAARIGAARLRSAGMEPLTGEFGAGRENLVARLKGSGRSKPLMLLAHIDVVGAEGQPWTVDPHTLTEKDGYLYGRGVSDDLGMAATNLVVFLALKESGIPLERDVILAWTGDEESGGEGIRHLLDTRPDLVDASVVINEGGARSSTRPAAASRAQSGTSRCIRRRRSTRTTTSRRPDRRDTRPSRSQTTRSSGCPWPSSGSVGTRSRIV